MKPLQGLVRAAVLEILPNVVGLARARVVGKDRLLMRRRNWIRISKGPQAEFQFMHVH